MQALSVAVSRAIYAGALFCRAIIQHLIKALKEFFSGKMRSNVLSLFGLISPGYFVLASCRHALDSQAEFFACREEYEIARLIFIFDRAILLFFMNEAIAYNEQHHVDFES